MMMIWLIQIFVPVALLAALAFWPARQRLVRLTQTAATVSLLLAAHLAGLRIVPPWWTPWLFWVLFIAALWRGRRVANRAGPRGDDAVLAALWLALLLGGSWAASEALRGRIAPNGIIADLAMPITQARLYVASGGSRELINAHLGTLPRATAGHRDYWGQSYGVDMIALDRWGRLSSAGISVLAPCNGKIVGAQNSAADSAPVDLSSPTARAGNYVLIRCGAFDVVLAHFRQGSIRVAANDAVRVGQPLGILGNSGASDMPHLHIHAQLPGTAQAPFSGRPVPIRLGGRFVVRGDRP